MSVTTKVRMIMTAANVSGRQLSIPLECPPQTAVNKLTRGLVRIDDMIKIVSYCEGSITMTAKDGTIIPLTMDDISK